MIELYKGSPGSGKSACVIIDMMHHILRGGIVASNFYLVSDWAIRLAKISSLIARYNDEYCLTLARKYWKRAFYVGDAETVKNLSQVMKPKKGKNGEIKKGSESLERFCGARMAAKREGLGKLYIDEAQLYFNSRSWAENMGFIEFFTQHRKLRWDVVLIAHSEIMLDKQIRMLFEYERAFRNLQKVKIMGIPCAPFPVFWSTQCYSGVGPGTGKRTTPFPDIQKLNMNYANLYDSMDVFGLNSMSGRIGRQPAEGLFPKRKDRKRKIIITHSFKAHAQEMEILKC